MGVVLALRLETCAECYSSIYQGARGRWYLAAKVGNNSHAHSPVKKRLYEKRKPVPNDN